MLRIWRCADASTVRSKDLVLNSTIWPCRTSCGTKKVKNGKCLSGRDMLELHDTDCSLLQLYR